MCIRISQLRKIDIFTKELEKSYVSWEIHKYDPFYNINNYNDLKIAENMINKDKKTQLKQIRTNKRTTKIINT